MLAQGPFVFVALERALTYLIMDTLAAARREVGAALQVVTFSASLVVVAALGARAYLARRRTQRWEFDQMNAASEMFKSRNSAIVPLRFSEED